MREGAAFAALKLADLVRRCEALTEARKWES